MKIKQEELLDILEVIGPANVFDITAEFVRRQEHTTINAASVELVLNIHQKIKRELWVAVSVHKASLGKGMLFSVFREVKYE